MRACPLVRTAATAFVLFAASAARADDDCPAGSKFRNQDGYTWCEPTVCENDGQCGNGEVCRPAPLCLQVGTLKPTGAAMSDAGQRLVATQRCAPDHACPATTYCSDMKRCLSRTAAESMGLGAATPAASSSAAASSAKKSSCGCHTVGDGGAGGAWAALGGGLIAWVARRRRQARTR